jgi:hypothetical protein
VPEVACDTITPTKRRIGSLPIYAVRRRDDLKNWPIGPTPHGAEFVLKTFNNAQMHVDDPKKRIGPFMFDDATGPVSPDFDLIETSAGGHETMHPLARISHTDQ